MNRSVYVGICLFLLWGCGDSATIVAVGADVPGTDLSSMDVVTPDLGSGDSCELTDSCEPEVTEPPPCEEGEGCFGDPCEGADDCLSSICTMHQGDNVCSKTCDEECPIGWSCKLVTGGAGDGQYACVSNFSHLCLPCSDAGDCSGETTLNTCVAYPEGGSFCGGACDLETNCPDGYSCQEVDTTSGGKSYQCVSDEGICDCSALAVESSLATPCSVVNDYGACDGARLCTEDGLSECDAAIPGPEVCNGVDDDCNGSIDESTCDDGNPCTEDTCAGADGCQHTPLTGTECLDGTACTQADLCQDGECVGTPLNCDDGNGCTDDSCEADKGCVYTPNFADCDDGDACTLADTCKDGVCVSGTSLSCDNGNPCTDDACGPTGCTHTPNNAPCDDGNACTTDDVCQNGGCTSAALLNCDDDNGCTTDTCNPAVGCETLFNELPCDDGSLCTVGDVCTDGACTVGALSLPCDDGNPCTNDGCDALAGCQFTANTDECDDQNDCTVSDVCSGGSCLGEGSKACDDGNPCTVDSCLPNGGCQHEPATNVPCDDGDICSQGDTCQVGVCTAGADLTCNDGNDCTDDTCDPQAGCTFTANADDCDDGNACTTGDGCLNGACTFADSIPCDDGNLCTDDACDATIGCTHTNNEQPCTDGDTCTVGDVCNGGSCEPGSTLNCNDGNLCTDDGCDANSGCTFTPNNLPCEDGSACTEGDSCIDASCQAGDLIPCDDGNPCTDDSCDKDAGCTFTDNQDPCDDGDACTNNDGCAAGVCEPGDPLVCDDGLFCNGLETCDSDAGCVNGDAPETDDGIDCTVDACDEVTDTILHTPQDSVCDTNELCVTDICDPQAGCQSSITLQCCGNGIQEDGEQCDDSNIIADDGCSPTCQQEAYESCVEARDQNPGAASGAYTLDFDGPGGAPSIDVYCDMEFLGGGWLAVYNQKDGDHNASSMHNALITNDSMTFPLTPQSSSDAIYTSNIPLTEYQEVVYGWAPNANSTVTRWGRANYGVNDSLNNKCYVDGYCGAAVDVGSFDIQPQGITKTIQTGNSPGYPHVGLGWTGQQIVWGYDLNNSSNGHWGNWYLSECCQTGNTGEMNTPGWRYVIYIR